MSLIAGCRSRQNADFQALMINEEPVSASSTPCHPPLTSSAVVRDATVNGWNPRFPYTHPPDRLLLGHGLDLSLI